MVRAKWDSVELTCPQPYFGRALEGVDALLNEAVVQTVLSNIKKGRTLNAGPSASVVTRQPGINTVEAGSGDSRSAASVKTAQFLLNTADALERQKWMVAWRYVSTWCLRK